jgi:hypothetical protein
MNNEMFTMIENVKFEKVCKTYIVKLALMVTYCKWPFRKSSQLYLHVILSLISDHLTNIVSRDSKYQFTCIFSTVIFLAVKL